MKFDQSTDVVPRGNNVIILKLSIECQHLFFSDVKTGPWIHKNRLVLCCKYELYNLVKYLTGTDQTYGIKIRTASIHSAGSNFK